MLEDHEIAQLVNDLTLTAKQYASHQSLRERLKMVVMGYINPDCIKPQDIPQNSEITAEQVKTLRELTGNGIAACKLALLECNGDIVRAKNYLRCHYF